VFVQVFCGSSHLRRCFGPGPREQPDTDRIFQKARRTWGNIFV